MQLTPSRPDIEFLILDPRLEEWGLPEYQSSMAAAIDLHACADQSLSIAPGSPAILISAGFAMHIADPGIAALIAPRSGMGHKRGLVLGNSVGVIDADYTGTVMVSVWNRNPAGSEPIRIEPGERIAQMIFVPILRPRFTVVTSFSASSERGAGGFGSTG
ncbi:dUTP diphosphatase [Variovorax sp. PBL-E5]|uniref:dUTP diphosphatase n=1 Tax=Variovorax sp. PBL-E5 TaxID=434014 RepID=UPI00131851AE|nr:dUTP diphosphatase [Variovorax sp. PBL-E5]VTU31251.1 Deoxyuridine 5'-triphosphate nucleotidohydrolase [Variovorax sp. PBL-E5]